MNMDTARILSRLRREIRSAAAYWTSEESKTRRAETDRMLDDFLAGADDLSYTYEHPRTGTHVIHQNIADVLRQKAIECVYPAVAGFLDDGSKLHYAALFNAYYLDTLAAIAQCRFPDGKLTGVFDSDLCMSSLFSLAFLGAKEQASVMQGLKLYLDMLLERNRIPDRIKTPCVGGHSVLPLSILLYNRYSDAGAVITDLSLWTDTEGKPLSPDLAENLNEVYRAAYDGFLLDDEKAVNSLISGMCDFHLENGGWGVKTRIHLFRTEKWHIFPAEILCLLRLRKKHGKSTHFIRHPLIDPLMNYAGCEARELLSGLSLRLRDEIFKRFVK